MAKLRVQADLIFDDDDPAAADTYNALVALAPRLGSIPGSRRDTPSRVSLHRCQLELDGIPCEPLQSWEAG